MRNQPAGRLGEEENEEGYDTGDGGLQGGGDSPGQGAVEMAIAPDTAPASDYGSNYVRARNIYIAI